MPRLMNDLNYLLTKKPISIVQYIDPYGKIKEYDVGDLGSSSHKRFEIRVKGQDHPKMWDLLYPPYKDELGRDIYVCPYNATTNINFDHFENNDMLRLVLQNLDNRFAEEFYLGIEDERRRQLGKGDTKKKFPLAMVLIVTGVVFIIVLIVMVAIIYFMG